MDLMLPPGRIFHNGYAVPELEPAMAELTAILGLEWASISERTMRIADPDHGLIDADVRVGYSTTGPPHVELIQSVTPTMWSTETAYLHHVGVWARDIEADSARLERSGLPRDSYGLNDDGSTRFVFHRHPFGPLIELIPVSSRARFEQWMTAGALVAAEPPPSSPVAGVENSGAGLWPARRAG
jgi:hypothetical protein